MRDVTGRVLRGNRACDELETEGVADISIVGLDRYRPFQQLGPLFVPAARPLVAPSEVGRAAIEHSKILWR